jgi:GT2 family glycosyltransferase
MSAAGEQGANVRPAAAPVVSVVICTLDRAELLKLALKSLSDQAAPRQSFEVIVVDNGSTDDTPAVARSFEGVLDLGYVREGRTGLSHARNAGWAAARGAYVAYLDDDARARPDWVQGILAAVAQQEPDVIGGPHLAAFQGGRPAWFPEDFESWSPGDRDRELCDDEYAKGMNFVVKRSVLERLGGFRPDLGMAGASPGYGEETELQCRIRRLVPGAKLIYRPGVVVHHLVRPEKTTLAWQLRRCVRQGLQAGAIYDRSAFGVRKCPRLHALAAMLGHLALAALEAAACPLRSRRAYPFWKAYVLLKVCPHVYSVFAYASVLLGPSGGPGVRASRGEVGDE